MAIVKTLMCDFCDTSLIGKAHCFLKIRSPNQNIAGLTAMPELMRRGLNLGLGMCVSCAIDEMGSLGSSRPSNKVVADAIKKNLRTNVDFHAYRIHRFHVTVDNGQDVTLTWAYSDEPQENKVATAALTYSDGLVDVESVISVLLSQVQIDHDKLAY